MKLQWHGCFTKPFIVWFWASCFGFLIFVAGSIVSAGSLVVLVAVGVVCTVLLLLALVMFLRLQCLCLS